MFILTVVDFEGFSVDGANTMAYFNIDKSACVAFDKSDLRIRCSQ